MRKNPALCIQIVWARPWGHLAALESPWMHPTQPWDNPARPRGSEKYCAVIQLLSRLREPQEASNVTSLRVRNRFRPLSPPPRPWARQVSTASAARSRLRGSRMTSQRYYGTGSATRMSRDVLGCVTAPRGALGSPQAPPQPGPHILYTHFSH